MKNVFVYYCCAVESVGNAKRFPNDVVKLKTFPHHGTSHSLKCKHLDKTLHIMFMYNNNITETFPCDEKVLDISNNDILNRFFQV